MTLKEFFIKIGINLDEGAFSKAQGALFRVGQAIRDMRDVAETLFAPLIDSISSMEMLRAALVTTEGSAEAAREQFDRLKKIAVETPFALDEVTKAYTRLKVQGLDASRESLLAFGDIAASFNGKNILDFVEAVSDATTGEFERLKEFGIKMGKEGDKVTIRFKGQTQTIKNDAASIQAALRELANTNFGGAMERQAETLGGQISNLKLAFVLFLDEIGKAGLSEALGEFVKQLGISVKSGGALAKVIGKVLSFAIKTLVKAFSLLRKPFNFLIENWGTIASVLGGVVLAAILLNIGAIASLIAGYVAAGAAAVASGLAAAASWFLANLPLIALATLFALIILLAQDIYGWLTGQDSLIGSLWEKYKGFIADWLHPSEDDGYITAAFKWLIRAIINLPTFFKEAFEWIGKAWDDLVQYMKDLFWGMVDGVVEGVKYVLDYIPGVDFEDSNPDESVAKLRKQVSLQFGAGATPGASAALAGDLLNTRATRQPINPSFKSEIKIEGSGNPEETAKAVQRAEAEFWDAKMRELEAGA